MPTLTSFVFLAVLLASVVADADRAPCSPTGSCEELKRRVDDKRNGYETLCEPDNNLPEKCCEDIKKEVEKFEDAYDVFCANKQPTQARTTPEATPPAPTTQAKATCPRPQPLGMQSGAIPNSAILASSKYTINEQPYYARLRKTGSNHCLWAPSRSDAKPWIEIKLPKISVITAVATQGSCNNPKEWVTSYVIRYSINGKVWTSYNGGQPLPANKDPRSVVKNELKTPFEAAAVRIYPKTMNNVFYSMRLELYGCPK